jgi:glycosyltransferase involved in cell wall biosynthesis
MSFSSSPDSVFSSSPVPPLVFVLLPVQNVFSRSLLPLFLSALNSLLRQTYSNLSICLIDDHSTDKTLQFLQSLLPQFPRLSLVSSTFPEGLSGALNFGLSKCPDHCEFIVRMDSDDYSQPERIQRQVEFMRENPSLAVLGGSVVIQQWQRQGNREQTEITKEEQEKCCLWLKGESEQMNENKQDDLIVWNNRLLFDWELVSDRLMTFPLFSHEFAWESLFYCPLAHPTAIIRKSAVDKIIQSNQSLNNSQYQLYDSGWIKCEDYELWLRMQRLGLKFATLPGKPILQLRKHGKNSSTLYREIQSQNSNLALQVHLMEWLKQPVKIEIVRLLGKPNDLKNIQAECLVEAVMLLIVMEERFISQLDKFQVDKASASEWIKNEVSKRVGELWTLAVRELGENNSLTQLIWKKFIVRNPKALLMKLME